MVIGLISSLSDIPVRPLPLHALPLAQIGLARRAAVLPFVAGGGPA
jgi:hypothetical protein